MGFGVFGFGDFGILKGVENKLVPNATEMISMGFWDLGISEGVGPVSMF